MILDGVYAPNVNRHELMPAGFLSGLDNVVAQCTADAECATRYPDFRESLDAVLGRTASSPIPLDVKSPADRSPVRLDVFSTDLTSGLFTALYDADVVRALPYLIDQLAQGNDEALAPLAQRSLDQADLFTEGLELSDRVRGGDPVQRRCADRRGARRRTRCSRISHCRTGSAADCATWAVPALSSGENAVVVSGIPTLLMSGGYDPITPLSWSEAAAGGLSAHRLYHFPTMGHGSVWANWVDDCPASIAQQFLRDPGAEPDASCISAMRPTQFLTDGDIHATSAIYRFNSDVVQDRQPVPLATLILSLGLLIATLVYAIAYGLAWLGRRDGRAPAGAVPAAAAAAVFNLAYAGGLALVALNSDPLILAFGIPLEALPLVILPFVALACAILLAVILVRAWRQRDGTLLHRIALSVSAAASLGFAVWLLVRGLLLP